MMEWLNRSKVGVEIAKMLFEIWCMVTDRNKKDAERERRIRELEDRVAELARKAAP